MAKRAKTVAVTERHIYKPDDMNCRECGEQLAFQKYYQWRKTVQHLTGAVYVASWGATCPTPECGCHGEVVTSPAAQNVTVPGCTYGLDVIAQIGWWRDQEHLDRAAVHSRLLGMGVQLSERQVDYLYNQYQILLACVGNQDRSRLQAVVETHGGLKVSLDGLSPEGASEQLWVVREVASQITLVVAWLDKVDHETLQTLLQPVTELEMPILATVSDKQPCVKKALEELWPEVPHQWCQPHYLGNVADPLYEEDRKLKTQMRQDIRAEVRASLAEVLNDEDDSAVHFVAGVAVNGQSATDNSATAHDEPPADESPDPERLPHTLSPDEPAPDDDQAPSPPQLDTTATTLEQPKTMAQIVREFALDLKECLARQGRAPFVLAGLPMFDDLSALRDTILACLALYEDPHLRHWATVLTAILSEYTDEFAAIKQASRWVDEISHILHSPNLPVMTSSPLLGTVLSQSDCIQQFLTAFMDALAQRTDLPPWLAHFRAQLIAITQRYWSGLFHCYDIAGLPTSNNALEALFGQAKRLIRRRLGIQQLRDTLRRHAPWALIVTTATSAAELLDLFCQVNLDDYRAQRTLFEDRLQQLRHRFRWRHQRDSLLQQRLLDWADAALQT